MSDQYIHARINAVAIRQTPKAMLVEIHGKDKWLAYSKILTIDTKADGTVEVDNFKKNFKPNEHHIESVEMDAWLATEIHGLEIIED